MCTQVSLKIDGLDPARIPFSWSLLLTPKLIKLYLPWSSSSRSGSRHIPFQWNLLRYCQRYNTVSIKLTPVLVELYLSWSSSSWSGSRHIPFQWSLLRYCPCYNTVSIKLTPVLVELYLSWLGICRLKSIFLPSQYRLVRRRCCWLRHHISPQLKIGRKRPYGVPTSAMCNSQLLPVIVQLIV